MHYWPRYGMQNQPNAFGEDYYGQLKWTQHLTTATSTMFRSTIRPSTGSRNGKLSQPEGPWFQPIDY